ncbi:hypothetical protein LSAT2_018850 [Lamellibrachia satsuma]|nr:hypothetical protein LSAT2_018850 [Lamellibrachia satsuma]
MYEPNLPPDANLLAHHVISSKRVCGSVIMRRNGIVYSHYKAFSRAMQSKTMEPKEYHYPDDINCKMTIIAGKGWKIQFQFPYEIKLACSTDRSTCDCLSIFDGPSVNNTRIAQLCDYHDADTLGPIETSGNFVTLRFRTDKNCRNDEGFRIKYHAFRYNHTGECSSEEEFKCDGNRCIPITFACDNNAHCVDRTDEGARGCAAARCLCPNGGLTLLHLTIFLGIVLLFALLLLLVCCAWVKPWRMMASRKRDTTAGGFDDKRDTNNTLRDSATLPVSLSVSYSRIDDVKLLERSSGFIPIIPETFAQLL